MIAKSIFTETMLLQSWLKTGIITMNVSGYSTVAAGAELGDEITVAGYEGRIISSSAEATAEDFTKFSAQGRALLPDNKRDAVV